MPSLINYNALNAAVKVWHEETKRLLRREIATNTKHSKYSSSAKPLSQRVGGKTRQKFGMVERVGFSFPQHMVFVEKGVGRGTPISKVGTTKRKPNPTFNPLIENRLPLLADIAAENIADIVARNLFIK